jgi:BolA protein
VRLLLRAQEVGAGGIGGAPADRHRGHAGARPGGESHFNVTIEAEAFRAVPRVARQRMVYRALADELAGPVHALTVKALAPGEE